MRASSLFSMLRAGRPHAPDLPVNPSPSTNFAFLAHHDPRLVALPTQAEEHFTGDPTITLFKLRQFGEVLAQRAAAKVALFVGPEEGQQQLINRLWEKNVMDGERQRAEEKVNRWRASLEKRGYDVSALRLPTLEEAEHGVFLEDAEREVRELTE